MYYEMLEHKKNKLKDFESLSFYKSNRLDIHALYIPERRVDFAVEISRLKKVINRVNCLNVFVSEGTFLNEISNQHTNMDTDAFGHIKLDSIDTGKWLSELISKEMRIDKVLVQKSGYFSRSSAPSQDDINYIFKICDFGFKQAIQGNSGVAAEDQRTDVLACIDFNEIKGDKKLNIQSNWFKKLDREISNE
tara:strand:- start:130 stop:705 length:576 start_codon:yes stop_codon:yes gene_type:complete